MDITFNGVTMKTPVYIKMDGPVQLLLGEGVCRQLNIISYHPLVDRGVNRKQKLIRDPDQSNCLDTGIQVQDTSEREATFTKAKNEPSD